MRMNSFIVTSLSVVVLAACGTVTSKPPNTSLESTTKAPSKTTTTEVQQTSTTKQSEAIGGSPSPPTTQASPTTTASTASSPPPSGQSSLRYGPGPQERYSVQQLPPPGSCHYTYAGADPLPDPNCTPGALNPQVTQSTIASTICKSGYTSAIRPPESVTEHEKQASASAYGYTGSFSIAEFDHLVPLELGGDPNDPANLWIEPNDKTGATSFANSKDKLENRLKSLVCSGNLSLSTAQQAIASNWAAAYKTYMGS